MHFAAIGHSAARVMGLAVRCGLHTGEVTRGRGGEPAGVAVRLVSRVAAAGRPGDVVVSRTVSDLVAGSGLQFHRLPTSLRVSEPGEDELGLYVADNETAHRPAPLPAGATDTALAALSPRERQVLRADRRGSHQSGDRSGADAVGAHSEASRRQRADQARPADAAAAAAMAARVGLS